MYTILSSFSTKDSRRPSKQIAAKWIAWRESSHSRKMAASISVSQIKVWINADALPGGIKDKCFAFTNELEFRIVLNYIWIPMCYRLSSFGQDMIQVFFKNFCKIAWTVKCVLKKGPEIFMFLLN